MQTTYIDEFWDITGYSLLPLICLSTLSFTFSIIPNKNFTQQRKSTYLGFIFDVLCNLKNTITNHYK